MGIKDAIDTISGKYFRKYCQKWKRNIVKMHIIFKGINKYSVKMHKH